MAAFAISLYGYWEVKGRGKGKDCVYLTSRVGSYSSSIDLYQLVKEAGYGIYTTVTVVGDKDKAGKPCESIMVQASPVSRVFKQRSVFVYFVGSG